MEDDNSKQRWYFRVIFFFLLLHQSTGFQDCPSAVVGVADPNIIPDSSFTASTELRDEYGADKARFTSDRCWEPSTNKKADDYLQIDLGKVFVICAVATKGNKKYAAKEWTEEYKISTSVDGTTWTWYPDNDNVKTFTGNADSNNAVRNILDAPVKAKLIRFTPTKWNNYKALRVELYGVNVNEAFSCKSFTIGVASVAKIPNGKMTSSSHFNTSTPPSNGRLGHTTTSSWCSAMSDPSPFLQVDLSKSYIICGVVTQGDHKSRQWVQTYQMQTSAIRDSFSDYYKENNITKVFSGNIDSDTIVQNSLFDGAVGRYIRIRPESSFGSTTCMRTELYGVQQDTVCSKIYVGVASPVLVPNHRFSASSSYDDDRYLPSSARLRLPKAWEPADGKQSGSWLHIDLGSVVYICAVSTQGNGYGADEYAKNYKLKVSSDNVNWQYYQENKVDKVFTGNINKDGVVTNTLAVPTKAKFLRFYPTDFAGFPAMRVEVYGVPVVCGKPFGLEKGGNLGNIVVTASSSSDSSHDAPDGRLYGDASWCSKTKNTSEYIQIDFRKMVTLTGIATQGDDKDDKWVKTYILRYSLDEIQWNDYREVGNNLKVFQGNSDKSGIVVRWLNRPTTVRYIRVHPQTWNSDICMRLELFGCSSPSTLKISELSNKNLTASSGSYVTLTCKVQEPLVQSIEWLFDGKVATHLSGGIERDATSVNSSLLVNYTSAAGVFADSTRCSKEAKFVICRRNIVCKVRYTKNSNSGESIQGAEVQIRLDYPSAPSLTTVSNKLTDSVEINWTGNIKDSQPVDRFLIKYWNDESTNTVNVTKTLKTYKVTRLLACTHYNVSIKAVGALGEGPWSKTLNFRTESELPKPPSNVIVTKKTSQSIHVEWQVPAGIRCPPNGSRISFSTSKGGAWTTKIVSDGQTTSYNIQSLSKWTDYYIKVEVGNEKGYSSPSLPIKERTGEDKPDAAPTNLEAAAASSTSIRLTWGLPAIGKRNGVIKGFRISYCKINDCPTRIAKQLGNNSTLTHIFDKLNMYTKYSFKILAYTSEGNGPYSKEVIMITDEGPPSKPLNIETVDIAPDGSFGPRLRVSWDVPSPLNGKYIRKYSVSYKADGMNVVDNTLNDNKTTTILNVCGGVNYVINVWARTVSDGEKAKKDVTTNTYAPMNVPSGLKSHEHNTSTFNISWLPIPSTEGRILVYELSVLRFNSTARLSNLQTFINVTCPEVACRGSARHRCSHVLHNLPQCAKFNLSVRAYTDKGHGKLTEDFTLETSVPGPSRELKTENIGKNSVKLTWLQPQPLSKPVLKYTIKYFGEKEYDFDEEKTFDGEEETKMTSLTITGLYPATKYRFIVSAATECAEKGEYSKPAFADTETGAPPAPTKGDISTISGTVANITLWKISAINGLISEILVFVENVQSGQKKRRSIPDCQAKASEAYKLGPSKRFFTLGDGKIYGEKKNKELSQGEEYKVYQCGVTRNKQQKPLYGGMVMIAKGKVPIKDDKSTQSGNPGGGSDTPLVVSLVVVFMVIIIVAAIVGVIFWRKRRNNQANDDMKLNNMDDIQQKNRGVIERGEVSTHANAGYVHNDNGSPEVCDDENADLYGNAEAIRHQPIHANKFNQYVNDRADSLKDEFKLLSSGQLFPWTAAKDPKNKPKNRYANIITYDHSRVVLQDTSNGSDYVNASYIHGFDGTPRTYIATQGPNPVSVPDFWQMVWQENIKTIVMLTNLIEAGKVKCHQYWPDKKETNGKFTVTLHRTDTMADYVVRVLIVCKDGETESRQVYHFQYISWPDKGVPQHATSVLGFRRKARSQYSSCSSTAPLLVHCSAGVGRTGAFLAVDAMMEKVKKDKTIDIFNYVQLMRDNRSTMVQTEEQYVFVHRALQEAITCGNTEIPVLNLNIAMGKLAKPRPKDQQTGYESEWKRLTAISPKVTSELSKAGRQQNNRPRNRYQDIVPFDSSRVFLSQEHQNYINASFADAFRERNAFIMTQAPLMSTVSDFWHMVHQYKIGSIVMLNKLQEENESFLQYLPKKGSETYNGFTVEAIKKTTSGPLVITKCVITHSQDQNNPHNFVHIQHTDWPKDGAPSDCQSILDIVDRVQKAQQQSCNAPIAVQCSDGVGRSGTFCAVYSIIERVKSEQVVDVFQAIKVLRLGRPNAMATLEQYKFCYKMVQTYLDSFNDYANFSEV